MTPRSGRDDDGEDDDAADEWDDPPLPGERDQQGRRIAWPSNGFESAAWGGWLALAYAGVTGAELLLAGQVPRFPALVGLLGVGLLVGVHLGGGDPLVWRR
jgi:hypothetical protein